MPSVGHGGKTKTDGKSGLLAVADLPSRPLFHGLEMYFSFCARYADDSRFSRSREITDQTVPTIAIVRVE